MNSEPVHPVIRKTTSLNHRVRVLVVVCLALALPTIIGLRSWAMFQRSPDENTLETRFVEGYSEAQLASFEVEEKLRAEILAGGEFHGRLRAVVDIEGLGDPEFVSVESVSLPDSTPVIGVEFSGKTYSFVIASLLDPRGHIVNFLAGDRPLSVTYCDINDCVRVFGSRSDREQPIPLRVGGLDYEDSMILLLDGKRYSQNSEGIPLDQIPFHRTTLGEWIVDHPETLVYVGDDRFDD